jgi:hypothetical protein
MFTEGSSPTQVAITLNLREKEVNEFYREFICKTFKTTFLLLVLTSIPVPVVMASATVQDDNSNDNGSSEGGYYNVGYEDGQNGSFSENAFQDNCGPLNSDNRYYQGFIDGCMSVEGNTRDVCESATDA